MICVLAFSLQNIYHNRSNFKHLLPTEVLLYYSTVTIKVVKCYLLMFVLMHIKTEETPTWSNTVVIVGLGACIQKAEDLKQS